MRCRCGTFGFFQLAVWAKDTSGHTVLLWLLRPCAWCTLLFLLLPSWLQGPGLVPGVEGSQAGALELSWALPDFLLGLQVESTPRAAAVRGMTSPPGWDHLLGYVTWISGTQGSAQGPTPGDGDSWSRSRGTLRGVRHLGWEDGGLLPLRG